MGWNLDADPARNVTEEEKALLVEDIFKTTLRGITPLKIGGFGNVC